MKLEIDLTYSTSTDLNLARDFIGSVLAQRSGSQIEFPAIAQGQVTQSFPPQQVASPAAAQPEVAQNTGSSQPLATPSLGEAAGQDAAGGSAESAAAPAAVDIPKLKRAGRPKKEAAAQVDPTNASLSAASSSATSPADTVPVPITLDDLRAALQKIVGAKGMPAAIDLLKSFGAQRISELASEKQADFIAACNEQEVEA